MAIKPTSFDEYRSLKSAVTELTVPSVNRAVNLPDRSVTSIVLSGVKSIPQGIVRPDTSVCTDTPGSCSRAATVPASTAWAVLSCPCASRYLAVTRNCSPLMAVFGLKCHWVAPEILVQSVPFGDDAHRHETDLTPPSGSLSRARSTKRTCGPVGRTRTSPGSSELVTVTVTSMVSSTTVSEIPVGVLAVADRHCQRIRGLGLIVEIGLRAQLPRRCHKVERVSVHAAQ